MKKYIIWTSVVVFALALLGCGVYYYLMYLLPRQMIMSMIRQETKWKAEEIFKEKDVIELCQAIEKNDNSKVDTFLNSDVNINATGKKNITPLFWALASDNFESYWNMASYCQ